MMQARIANKALTKKLGITYLQKLGIGLSFISSGHSQGTAEALKPHTIWTRQIADGSEMPIQAPQGESIKRTRPEQAL